MAKSKRSNYLIDKPFQIGFITRFLIIIILTIIIAFSIVSFYYWFTSSVGEYKYNTVVVVNKRGPIKFKGRQVYDYDKEKIQVYRDKDKNGNSIFVCFDKKSSDYKKGDIIENVDEASLTKTIGNVPVSTNFFVIILFPMIFTGIALIVIISIYSLFFSHRVAGPIYRIRVSLDKMLSGDFDFKISARKTDFFLNIVSRLDEVRQKFLDLKNENKKTPRITKSNAKSKPVSLRRKKN